MGSPAKSRQSAVPVVLRFGALVNVATLTRAAEARLKASLVLTMAPTEPRAYIGARG